MGPGAAIATPVRPAAPGQAGELHLFLSAGRWLFAIEVAAVGRILDAAEVADGPGAGGCRRLHAAGADWAGRSLAGILGIEAPCGAWVVLHGDGHLALGVGACLSVARLPARACTPLPAVVPGHPGLLRAGFAAAAVGGRAAQVAGLGLVLDRAGLWDADGRAAARETLR